MPKNDASPKIYLYPSELKPLPLFIYIPLFPFKLQDNIILLISLPSLHYLLISEEPDEAVKTLLAGPQPTSFSPCILSSQVYSNSLLLIISL